MDMFKALSQLDCVARVSNINREWQGPLGATYYLSPNSSGLEVNATSTGFTTTYSAVESSDMLERTRRLAKLRVETEQAGIALSMTGYFTAAQAQTLFPTPVSEPKMPMLGMAVRPDTELVRKNLPRFWYLYGAMPWQEVPQRIVSAEARKLAELLPATSPWQPREAFLRNPRQPSNPAEDFIARTFASYALSGLLLRESALVAWQRIVIALESPGVAMLRNAALPKNAWLPVIQLR